MNEGAGGFPFLLRLSGIPVSTLERFAAPRLAEIAEQQNVVESERAALTTSVVDRLFLRVHDAAPEDRRFFLALKRDTFNSRLAEREDSATFPLAFESELSADFKTLIELERKLERLDHELRKTLDQERLRESHLLDTCLDDPAFRQSLVFASRDLQASLSRRREDLKSRRQRKTELSLWRYLSRAAVKTSPFALLTRVGWGTTETKDVHLSEYKPGALSWLNATVQTFPSPGWVRLQRYVADQLREVLWRQSAFRAKLEARWNDTVTPLENGRWHWLSPAGWILAEDKLWRFRSIALREAAVKGELPHFLAELLGKEKLSLGELVERVAARGAGDAVQAEKSVEKLVELGLILLVSPWDPASPRIEYEIAASVADLDVFLPLAAGLAELIHLEERLGRGEEASLESLERCLDRLFTLADIEARFEQSPRNRIKKEDFSLDGLLSSPPPKGAAGLAENLAREALATGDRLLRFFDLFDPRHELQAALVPLLAAAGGELPLLEAFRLFQPLLRDFATHLQASSGQTLFRHLEPEAGTMLERQRAEARDAWKTALRPDGNELLLDLDHLETARWAAADSVSLGSCVFVQSTAAGKLVLNELHEGSGRNFSRFVTLLPQAEREHWLARLRQGGQGVTTDGRPWQLLDIPWSGFDNLNVHTWQTPLTLEFPGEACPRPETEKVRLGDLRLALSPDGCRVELMFGASRLIPVFLGGSGIDYLPLVLRFLVWLGPYRLERAERSAGFWEAAADGQRVRSGAMVLRRASWRLERGVFGKLADLSGIRLLQTLTHWRHHFGVPSRVFARELGAKPQFLDLTSPLCLELLRLSLASQDQILLEEALPDSSDHPKDVSGQRWASEIVLDHRAFS